MTNAGARAIETEREHHIHAALGSNNRPENDKNQPNWNEIPFSLVALVRGNWLPNVHKWSKAFKKHGKSVNLWVLEEAGMVKRDKNVWFTVDDTIGRVSLLL